MLKTLAMRAGGQQGTICFKSYVEQAAATELPSGDDPAEWQRGFVRHLRLLGEGGGWQIGLGNDEMSQAL